MLNAVSNRLIVLLLAPLILYAGDEKPSILMLRDGRLQVIWPTVRGFGRLKESVGNKSFAVGADGSVLYSAGACFNPSQPPKIKLIQKQGNETVITYRPEISFPESGVDYRYFSISSHSRYGAFVVTPCADLNTLSASRGELAYVVVVDLKSGIAKMVSGSVDETKVPIGAALQTSFSPDEQLLLVNYETGFLVFRVSEGKQMFSMNESPLQAGTWTTSLGWISNHCIAFTEGASESLPQGNSVKILNWKSGATETLVSVFPWMKGFSAALDVVQYPLAVQLFGKIVRVISLETGEQRSLRLNLSPDSLYLVDSGALPVKNNRLCSEE
jgi:hypothetical protein